MKVTIIVDDGLISVDGRGFTGIDMTGFTHIHAVQWYGTYGEVEFKPDADGLKPPNATIRDVVMLQPILDRWEARRVAEDTPKVPTLEEAKATKRKQINDDRDQHIAAGVVFNGITYDSDQRSRDNLTGAVAAFSAGVPVPKDFAWRSADNTNVPMTVQELVGLAVAMLVHVNTAYAVSWKRKTALDAATTLEEVAAV